MRDRSSHRISTIERRYPDQWVLIEVTRWSERQGRTLAGRMLAHAAKEHDITLATKKARKERPDAHLFAFYTGDLIPEGMVVIPPFFVDFIPVSSATVPQNDVAIDPLAGL